MGCTFPTIERSPLLIPTHYEQRAFFLSLPTQTASTLQNRREEEREKNAFIPLNPLSLSLSPFQYSESERQVGGGRDIEKEAEGFRSNLI
jgi:hypothetical protein